MGEPGGLPSVGSHRVRHDWSDFAAAYGCWGFPGGSDGKESASKRETWVQSLGWEGPLEEGMATHSNVLAWRIPGMGVPGGLLSMGSHRVGHD